jgi:uncharacterized protein YqhQ
LVGDWLSDDKKPAYGGQAVVEGVRFTGKKVYTTSIRRKDNNNIEHFDLDKKEKEVSNASFKRMLELEAMFEAEEKRMEANVV